jgi:hypothetical protein
MIKVGYLVSYDYDMLLTSVRLLYDYVDKIILSIDENRKTWSGNSFEIPDAFFDEVSAFDTKNKIEFYFDNFYVPEITPMECETRQRNLLLNKMGKGWKIQLDVDEYVYDFKALRNYLNKYWYLNWFPKLTPIVFRGKLVTLYRELPDGYLYIENEERFSFITNQSFYTYTRNNDKVRAHYTNFNVIHQSWARSEEEIQMKIKNWGHRDDFDTQNYFDFWKGLNSTNYKEHRNIHPMSPKVWNELFFLESNSIEDFIKKYASANVQQPIAIDYKLMFSALFKKLFK